jgi:DNA polymerase III delta prime subunit
LVDYKKQLDFLREKFEHGALAHAYIFSGQDTQGILQMANDFVKNIGCKFPDVITVTSDEALTITIEQIRQTQNFLALTSYYGGYKVVIIQDAERMNLEAQNCFLKNLEEPRGNTLIIIVTAKPELLLETLRSRCQEIKFQSQAQLKENQEVLKVLGKDLAEKFNYAKQADLEGEKFQDILSTLQNYFRNTDMAKHRDALTLLLDIERQAQTSNINKKLALETLFLHI